MLLKVTGLYYISLIAALFPILTSFQAIAENAMDMDVFSYDYLH